MFLAVWEGREAAGEALLVWEMGYCVPGRNPGTDLLQSRRHKWDPNRLGMACREGFLHPGIPGTGRLLSPFPSRAARFHSGLLEGSASRSLGK